MKLAVLIPLLSLGFSSLAGETETPPLPAGSPWKLGELFQAPAIEWIDARSPVRTLFYTGEAFRGKPTRVFAVYADPSTVGAPGQAGPWPGVVLVHGGGGTAFPEWVKLWAKRGYAAIAMDLGGMRPDLAEPNDASKRTPLPDGGPDQGHPSKFNTIKTEEVADDWPYHAVANVIRAHSLLRTLPGVDPEKTALTGISWGGYTTCLAASVDTRFKAAVPVYGCGFLHENSTWLKEFSNLGPDLARRWVDRYDPSRYLPSCRVPIFFVNGTNDFAYPLDSYMKSFDAVQHAPKNIRIQVQMPHGHEAGWAPAEIGAFIDSQLLGRPRLPLLESPKSAGGKVSCAVQNGPLTSGTLEFTTGTGPINKLVWQSVPATVEGEGQGPLSASLPEGARLYFFTGKNAQGNVVSSPAIILP